MDATALLYGTTGIWVVVATWIAIAQWQQEQQEQRMRRVIQKRLRQLQRLDAGFARGRV